MKTTEEKVKVMQAYLSGELIEFREGCGTGVWRYVDIPVWNWENYEYRIMPEPKYRPYRSAEEVMEAIKKHGSWLKYKDYYEHIIKVSEGMVSTESDCLNYKAMLNLYTWADDGTPFGVKDGE